MAGRKQNLVDAILLTMFAVLMYVLKYVMSGLPNIHPVALIIILLVRRYGLKSLLSVYIFVFCDIMTYGLDVWTINYLYVWAIFTFIILLLRKADNAFVYALVAALFGLSFGTLCSIPYFITGGVAGGVANIISGFTYDLLHCGGNFTIVLLLYRPLTTVLNKVLDKFEKSR